MDSLSVIRAGEVGRYAYCARAWWLQYVLGFEPANREALEVGEQRHDIHGRLVRRSTVLARAAQLVLLIAVALAVAAVVSFFRG